MKNSLIFILELSLISFLIVGCSDNNNSGASGGNLETTTKTGHFIDGYVKGIKYINGTREGFTDENGTFTYTDGNITFYLGNMELGTLDSTNVPGDNNLFVQDLVGVDRNETNNTTERTNIL